MAIAIQEVGGGRTIHIEDGGVKNPQSVFVQSHRSDWYEFDRRTLLSALKRELGLHEDVDVSIDRILETA